MDGKFRSDPVNHATFRAMLMQPEGITHAMRLMNQTSVLGRYLWVFRASWGRCSTTCSTSTRSTSTS
jgi:[protein-PII] uridylyltransferase